MGAEQSKLTLSETLANPYLNSEFPWHGTSGPGWIPLPGRGFPVAEVEAWVLPSSSVSISAGQRRNKHVIDAALDFYGDGHHRRATSADVPVECGSVALMTASVLASLASRVVSPMK